MGAITAQEGVSVNTWEHAFVCMISSLICFWKSWKARSGDLLTDTARICMQYMVFSMLKPWMHVFYPYETLGWFCNAQILTRVSLVHGGALMKFPSNAFSFLCPHQPHLTAFPLKMLKEYKDQPWKTWNCCLKFLIKSSEE